MIDGSIPTFTVNHVAYLKYITLGIFHHRQSNWNLRFGLSNLSQSATGLANVRYCDLQILNFKAQAGVPCQTLTHARLNRM
jgi:hypothetical protein